MRDSLKRLVEYAGNPEKTEYGDLQQALHYAQNGEKTVSADERFCFVTGIGCWAETAYEEMTAVKRRFGKTDGNVAYHAYQSFKPGEVTPEQCHALGVRLAKQLWGKDFQVLVVTHLDRNHLHNHFLINSVSFINGRKFNDDKRCYYRLRAASDALCREQALSVIQNPKGHTPRSVYFAEKNGEPTRFNLMREAIDTALKITSTAKDFKAALRDMGYVLNDDPRRKYASIRRVGSEKAVRLFRLGETYDLPQIGERLRDNFCRYGSILYWQHQRNELEQFRPPKQYHCKGSLASAGRIGGLRGFYLHYCYLLGILPKNSGRRPLSPQMREECRRMDEISRQTSLLCREGLNTAEDVQHFIDRKSGELDTLKGQRNGCYNRLRRCNDPTQIAEIKQTRDELTKQMGALRGEIKTAQGVLERSEVMHKNRSAELTLRAEHRGRLEAMQAKSKTEKEYER